MLFFCCLRRFLPSPVCLTYATFLISRTCLYLSYTSDSERLVARSCVLSCRSFQHCFCGLIPGFLLCLYLIYFCCLVPVNLTAFCIWLQDCLILCLPNLELKQCFIPSLCRSWVPLWNQTVMNILWEEERMESVVSESSDAFSLMGFIVNFYANWLNEMCCFQCAG